MLVRTVLLIVTETQTCLAETTQQIRQRLEEYHQNELDQETYRHNKKIDDFNKKWERFGDTELSRSDWKKQSDGTWVTCAWFNAPPRRTSTNINQVFESIRYAELPGPTCRPSSVNAKAWIEKTLGKSGNMWSKKANSASTMTIFPDQLAIDCKSLTINTYRGYWGKWERPYKGHPYELILIDRCTRQE
jgi:hypothetical protein